MFGQTWQHSTLRKYVILFGTLFNNLYVTRENVIGETIQTLRIPLSYGPKEKFLARLEGNPSLDREIAIVLPRMAFEMIDLNYDNDRKLGNLNKIIATGDNDESVKYMYAPVPYNIQFNLYVLTKNAEDGARIIEQILPYFTPSWTSTVNILPEMNHKIDVPLVLNSVSSEDTYEADFLSRRAIIWTLSFTMKAQLFGPIRDTGLIKEVDVNITIPPSNVSAANANSTNSPTTLNIDIRPGLTANGQPTSNAALSVDASQISRDDNYGFIIDFTEYI
jgi:hypothetical protein